MADARPDTSLPGVLELEATKFHSVQKFCFVNAEFLAADQDLVIPHTLRPQDPHSVRYTVIETSAPTVVYQDFGASRTPWQRSHILLRATLPATVRLMLFIEAETGAPAAPRSGTLYTPDAGLYTSVDHGDVTFTGSATGSADWTVASGDMTFLKWRRLDPSTVILKFSFNTTSVANAPVELRFAFTGGPTFSGNDSVSCNGIYTQDNYATQNSAPQIIARVSGNRVAIKLPTGAAWTNTTNLTGISGSLVAEAQDL